MQEPYYNNTSFESGYISAKTNSARDKFTKNKTIGPNLGLVIFNRPGVAGDVLQTALSQMFPSSQGPKFPSSQVPKFPRSQVPKFSSSQVPKFPSS